jgi:hypothetical protein
MGAGSRPPTHLPAFVGVDVDVVDLPVAVGVVRFEGEADLRRHAGPAGRLGSVGVGVPGGRP